MKKWKITLIMRSESDPNNWDWPNVLDEFMSESQDEAGIVEVTAAQIDDPMEKAT